MCSRLNLTISNLHSDCSLGSELSERRPEKRNLFNNIKNHNGRDLKHYGHAIPDAASGVSNSSSALRSRLS